MARTETDAHKELKSLSLVWAMEQGYTCCGLEISLPHSGFRADVAAYKPAYEQRIIEFEGKTIRQRLPVIGTTAVFECKQARSDLLKDSGIADEIREKLRRLNERRATLERLLKIHLPSTANGDSLFQEFQTHNLAAINHKGYQSVLREIATLQAGLFHKTKFEKLIRYRCANLFYLVTIGEILADYELPLNWGLLVKKGDSLELRRKPRWIEANEGSRLAVLQRIAMVSIRIFAN